MMNAKGKETRVVVTRKGVSTGVRGHPPKTSTKKTSKAVPDPELFETFLADKLESAVEDRLMELKGKLEATMNKKMDEMEANMKESIMHRMENQKKEILDAELQKRSWLRPDPTSTGKRCFYDSPQKW